MIVLYYSTLISLYLILLLLLILLFVDYGKLFTKSKNAISFEEAVRLTKLPIIPITINGCELNMLLDTGSSCSHLNSKLVKKLNLDLTKAVSGDCFGIEGSVQNHDVIPIDFTCKNHTCKEYFWISDLSKAFQLVKQDSGVTIHGILGSDFFYRNSYIIDYDSKTFYHG